jgi:hypothetical protein
MLSLSKGIIPTPYRFSHFAYLLTAVYKKNFRLDTIVALALVCRMAYRRVSMCERAAHVEMYS